MWESKNSNNVLVKVVGVPVAIVLAGIIIVKLEQWLNSQVKTGPISMPEIDWLLITVLLLIIILAILVKPSSLKK